MNCRCGCCAGVAAATPIPIFNRPGLAALAYRAGTHATFRESMLARLSSRRALDPLTTREPDDPAIALLDCWAVVGDVLTFYQERIANEGYLRTAVEAESIARLGELVGYRPRPPLGSSTYLAYTLDPGAQSVIPAGSGVKNVPAGGLPQTFETSEELVAREEWNTLAVRQADPPDITLGTVDALAGFAVDGTAANLKKGDRLLFSLAGDGTGPQVHARTVAESTVDFLAGRTEVRLVSSATPLEGFTAAVGDLAAKVTTAAGHAPKGPAAGMVIRFLEPLKALLSPDPDSGAILTPDEALGAPGSTGTVAWYLARLPEAAALAARNPDCALRDWLRDDLGDVEDSGRALIAVAVRLTGRSSPEMEQLRRLARFLACGDESGCGHPPCRDPYQATALVGLTPVVPALRRDPSRPPVNARQLATPVADLFRADSDVHPRLLAAADRRLAALPGAWRRQEIAPPPPLAEVAVLRVQATIAAADNGPVAGIGGADRLADSYSRLLLDAVHDTLLPGRPVLAGAADGSGTVVLVPDRVVPAQLPITAKNAAGTDIAVGTVTVTSLEFDTALDPNRVPVTKGTPLWGQGEPLTPVGAPILGDVGSDTIDLARFYDGLKPGRWVIVAGERTDVPYTSGVQAAELAMVAGVSQRLDRIADGRPVLQSGQGPQTRLLLANELAYTYKRSTVQLYGNVVTATQGETRQDILGHGDAGQAGQAMPLHLVAEQTPLTWTAADNPLGAQSTLTTRVDGVAWHETDALTLSEPNDHSYVLRTEPGGGESVMFGDGVHGARLPTGSENVTATYRTGAGRSGNVPAGTITQLSARALGVGGVTNPLPATGGADGDGPADARAGTPLRMQALDRLVSVRDYEDFTRARAGIGKASAVKLFDGVREVVHVTIAGVADAPIDPLSGLATALEQSLVDFGDLGVPVRVAERELRLIVLDAGVKVLPDHSWDLVQPAVRAALVAEFGFAARTLGGPAYLSEAIAAIQGVEGVDYVDVDVFGSVDGTVTPIRLAGLVAGLHTAAPCVPAVGAHFEERTYDVEYGDTLTSVTQRFGLHLDDLVALNPKLSGTDLAPPQVLTVFRGVRPAQLAALPDDVPEALTLRRIP
ncbi:putative baseplate assembly protein [Amycolatopsis sp. cmx-4-68]|uniref:putative baseplate assembly protein n=1 Tax=Amycolatopsis sp. cmx-4-68 TaxID=2790938 RepID=UPI003978A659